MFEALARLRGLGGPSAILDAAPTELSLAGAFDRVLVSRVDGSTWLPSTVHVVNVNVEVDAADPATRTLRGTRIPLTSSMVEAELIRRHRTVLVPAGASSAGAYRALVHASCCTAYVVAPILVGDEVVGLLHVDSPRCRVLEHADTDVIRVFADGLGMIHERALLLQRLDEQREQVQAAVAAVASTMGRPAAPLQLAWASAARAGAMPTPFAMAQRPPPTPAQDAPSKISEREREVLERLASGATNTDIARQLCISESTVKSHVKHIFRKLDVTTRAEAIVRYFRDQRAPSRRAS